MWSVPIRFLVMWAPITAVSVGGGIYLYECADTLLAPGTGFTFDYATPVGPLKIECETYTIDLLQQAVFANKLVIKKSDGTVVARVPQLVAKGIAIDEGLTPKVQLKDAEIWVNRDYNGDLDILKFLTPSEGTASQQPWQISIRDSKIHLRDWSATDGVRNEVLISSGNFVGMGDNTEGSLTLDVVGLTKGTITFKKRLGLTTISGQAIDAQLGAILNRLRAGREKKQLETIAPLRLASGNATGDFQVELPDKGKMRFTSHLSGSVKSLRWDNYLADTFDFKGTVTELGLTGSAKILAQGANADAEGSLAFGPNVAFGGNVKVAGLTPRHLEALKVKLPKNVSFARSNAEGYLTYQDGITGWKGKASVLSPSAFGLKPSQINADISLAGNQLLATIQPVTIGRTVVSGNFGYNLKTQAIQGAVSTPQADARDFSQWLPTEVLNSKAQVAVLIDGTVAKPNILAKGTLDPQIKLPDRLIDLHQADFVLRYDGNKFTLDRLSINDQVGSFYASGDIDVKKGINVRVVGNGVDLQKLAKDTSGKVDVQGQIVGKLSEPRYVGKLQGYNIGYSGVPGKILAVASDFSGDRKTIKFNDIEAMKGASQITGSIGIGLSDQKLAGLFAVNGIDIRDLYDGPVGGVLDLKDIAVSGTIGNPFVTGSFDAKKILAFNFSADQASGSINYDGEKFHITDGHATFAKGTITDLKGDISGKSITGSISGNFEKLDLSELTQSAMATVKESDGGSELPPQASQISVKGATSGSFELGIKDKKFASLTSKGRVDDVRLNKAFIGSGDWDAGFDGTSWTGGAFIGSLDKYFNVTKATYTSESGRIGGEFTSYQIPVQLLLTAVAPTLGIPDETLERLRPLEGNLGTVLQFSGLAKNPTVTIPEFEISAIKVGKEDLGRFSLNGKYENRNFSFREGLLEGPKNTKVGLPFAPTFAIPEQLATPDGTAKLAGRIMESGEIDVSGSIHGFPVRKFEALAPQLSKVDVFVNDATFSVKGTQEKPVLNSTVEVTTGATPDGRKNQTGLLSSKLKLKTDISAQPVAAVNDGTMKIDTKGGFSLSAITGTLESHFFLNSDFGLAQKAPLDVQMKLDGDRDVSGFFREMNGIVLGDDGARLTGGISVGNNFEDPDVTGGFALRAGSIKYTEKPKVIGRPIDLNLKDLGVSAKIEKDPKLGYLLHTQASTTSNYSKNDPTQPDFGYLKFNAKVPIDDLIKMKPNDQGFGNREILDGSLAFNRFGVYQGFLQGSYIQQTIETPETPIKIAGTLTKPKISGDIYFDDVKTVIPTLNPTQGGSEQSAIDPSFDIRFFAKNPMNIKSSIAELNAKGAGSLKGTLSNLKVNGELTVESGTLTLPGGNVKLSPDGTLELRYESTSFSNRAQLIANLHGETSLTALKNGVTPERYDISLDVKGDLLSTSQGLTLIASSQPGDLSQDRILQMLGRTDILTNFLQSGVSSSVESELRNALTSYALPSVLNGITNEIAKNFGLDYFGVDYNAFEQASLSFVKGLGSDFYLQGRQQLYQPLPGQPAAYDFRLAYRPRRGPNSIRALSFSIGTDQLRPYKLSIDFSSRVRTRKPPYQTIKLHVPNK